MVIISRVRGYLHSAKSADSSSEEGSVEFSV